MTDSLEMIHLPLVYLIIPWKYELFLVCKQWLFYIVFQDEIWKIMLHSMKSKSHIKGDTELNKWWCCTPRRISSVLLNPEGETNSLLFLNVRWQLHRNNVAGSLSKKLLWNSWKATKLFTLVRFCSSEIGKISWWLKRNWKLVNGKLF